MKKYTLLLFVALSLTTGIILMAQKEGAVTQELIDPIQQFLAMDNAHPEREITLMAQLQENAEEATTVFIGLLEAGIPAAARKDLEADYRMLYQQQAVRMEQGLKVTLEDPEGNPRPWKPTQLSEEEFVITRLQLLELQVQARALEGLAILKTKPGLLFLQSLADNPNHPLASLAEELTVH
jgi:hypothetical protein